MADFDQRWQQSDLVADVARGGSRLSDLHPDGERLAIRPAIVAPGSAKQDHVTFIFNFFDELRRIAPATRR